MATASTAYRFRHNGSRGRRYSLYVERFITDVGTRPALEWFDSAEELLAAHDEMVADGRFHGVHSYVRSQEAADAA